MAKPITQQQIDDFRAFCKETLAEDDSGYFSHYDEFDKETEDGDPLWEFHATNYDPPETHDIFELFTSVDDEFQIEQHGYDEFYVVPVKS